MIQLGVVQPVLQECFISDGNGKYGESSEGMFVRAMMFRGCLDIGWPLAPLAEGHRLSNFSRVWPVLHTPNPPQPARPANPRGELATGFEWSGGIENRLPSFGFGGGGGEVEPGAREQPVGADVRSAPQQKRSSIVVVGRTARSRLSLGTRTVSVGGS